MSSIKSAEEILQNFIHPELVINQHLYVILHDIASNPQLIPSIIKNISAKYINKSLNIVLVKDADVKLPH